MVSKLEFVVKKINTDHFKLENNKLKNNYINNTCISKCVFFLFCENKTI